MVEVTTSKLVDIADAIRFKTGGVDLLTLSQMAASFPLTKKVFFPGTYDKNDVMLKTWTQMVTDGDVVVDENNQIEANRSDGYDFSNVKRLVVPIGIRGVKQGGLIPFDRVKFVHFPEGMDVIGDWAFSGCTELSYVDLPDSITKIGEGAFYESSLKTIHVPKNLKEIGWGMFSACQKLTRIVIPEGVTKIGFSAFASCASLSSVSIPSTVTTIEKQAFSGCESLETIYIPETVTDLNAQTFDWCYNLKTIYYKGPCTETAPYAYFLNPTVITDF